MVSAPPSSKTTNPNPHIPQGRITILTGKSGHEFFLAKGLPAPRTWEPTRSQAEDLAQSAMKKIALREEKFPLENLYLQVVGVLSNDQKQLFGNCFLATKSEAEDNDWRLVPKLPTADKQSFQVWFDLRSQRILRLLFFGR